MKRLSWIIAVALVLLPAALAIACPMCKDSIPNSDSENPALLPVGINNSIFYMLFGLFSTIGLVTTVITKGVRSTNARMTNIETSLRQAQALSERSESNGKSE